MDPLTQTPPIELPNDIQTPELISQFPIAIGWWLLVLIIISLVLITTFSIKKYRAKRHIQKQAIEAIIISSSPLPHTLATLKWAAMNYFPRQEIASLSGENFLNYLATKLPVHEQASFTQFNPIITQSLYSKDSESLINTEFNHAACSWLKKALPPKATHNISASSEVESNGVTS